MGGEPTMSVLGVRVPMKYASLVAVAVQTSVMVLLLRASREVDEETPLYLTSTAVLLSECMKFLICMGLVFLHSPDSVVGLPGGRLDDEPGLAVKWRNYVATLQLEFVDKWWDTLKTAIPACTYVVQNNLLFLALSYIDAPTYQVTYQLKILTTAVCSVLMLGRKLDSTKWFSLVMLTVGVALVQASASLDRRDDESGERGEAGEGAAGEGYEADGIVSSLTGQLFGLLCVVSACFVSGFSGVYIEKVLKSSKCSIWIRNVQLSMFSLLPALAAVIFADYDKVMENGFFYGYDRPIVWLTVLCQASSGLVVAVVVKYADNILKGFATSMSIIISSVITMVLWEFHPGFYWLMGTCLVMVATVIYSGVLSHRVTPATLSGPKKYNV